MKKIVVNLVALFLVLQIFSGNVVKADTNYEEVNGVIDASVEEEQWFKDNKEVDNSNLRKNKSAIELPSVMDNSVKSYFPPIGNQGSLGSCTSFSTTYYQMTYMIGKKNNWTSNTSDKIMSPKWTYTMLSDGENGGTSIEGNIKLLSEAGVAPLSLYPYVGSTLDSKNYREWCINSATWNEAAKYKIDKFNTVNFNKLSSKTPIVGAKSSELNGIKEKLNEGYILTFAEYSRGLSYVNIKESNDQNVDNGYIGELAMSQPRHGENVLNYRHAMTIVGYNDNLWVDINENGIREEEEMGAFKVANSWDSTWGNKGFVWMAYDVLNTDSSVPGMPSDSTRYKGINYDELFYFDVKETAMPKLSLEFKLTHNRRNDLSIKYGVKTAEGYIYGDDSAITNRNGGAYPIGGLATSKTGIFKLDLKKLIEDPGFDNTKYTKWFISIKDNVTGEAVTVEDIRLTDENGKTVATVNEQLPISYDNGVKEFTLDYVYGNLEKPTIKVRHTIPSYFIDFSGRQSDGTKVTYELYENNKVVRSSTIPGDACDSFEFPKGKAGVYEYKLVIKDEKGKISQSDIVKVTVDGLKKPMLTSEQKDGPTHNLFAIYCYSVQEPYKKISYKLYENGVLVKENKGPFNGQDTYYFTKDEGVYNYKLVITDEYGNEAEDEETVIIGNPNIGETPWAVNKYYKIGDKVSYKNKNYECTYAHTSLDGWYPGEAAALWKEI